MVFQILITKEEMDYLEEAANALMRVEHVRKTDRKLIIESFKKIKGRLKKRRDCPFYTIAGSNEEELEHPNELGYEGFSWTAKEWNLVFVEPKRENSPIENFLENEINWENVIDVECSWDMR